MYYRIQDREAGNLITTANTKSEAESILRAYERSDKKEGIYTPNFYEIVKVNEKLDRYFLIYSISEAKITLHGIVKSDFFPSTIQNDHEYSLKKYGSDRCHVVELSEIMHINIGL